ncbi:hypothetical protein G6F32_015197 [Rhizopus arrhizus]|nr:hypothetical protein G6F32_015197 [Rhizopus arrhizus]
MPTARCSAGPAGGPVDRAAQAGRLHLLDQGHRPPDLRPAAAALPRPRPGAVHGRPPRPRYQWPAAADRRWWPAAPDHFAEVEAAQGLRSGTERRPARR